MYGNIIKHICIINIQKIKREKRKKEWPSRMAHFYNSSYSGGGSQFKASLGKKFNETLSQQISLT
jgi:hypothetical protein